MAEHVAMRTGLKCETFNAGSTPFDSLGHYLVGKKHSNITQHHIDNDIISASKGPGTRINYGKVVDSNHSMDNFMKISE